MIKVEIVPGLRPTLSFEIKKDKGEYRFIVIKSRLEGSSDGGEVWYSHTPKGTEFEALGQAIERIIEKPSTRGSVLISDGILISIEHKKPDQAPIYFSFFSPETNSPELEFILNLLDLGRKMSQAASFDLYAAEIEEQLTS